MQSNPDIATISALIGEPARAKMLVALLAGKALTATELAIEADITCQTASSHLHKLVAKGMLAVAKQGRHKYFQLGGTAVAELLEALLNVSAQDIQLKTNAGPEDSRLRNARVCYDHLAGELGVLLLDTLEAQKLMTRRHHTLHLTRAGSQFFDCSGAGIEELLNKRRPLCKACLDWSVRRHHLAGSLGNWILNDLFRRRWAQRELDSRAIRFTRTGLRNFVAFYKLPEHNPVIRSASVE
jgi:DNA-binding transcriptional ArsR family regulator